MVKMNCETIISILLATCLVLISGAKGREKALTDLEIRRELKRLNKPAVKSIKSGDGHIIDCIDIYKQPAFDHPLLKNHTIQMRPSNYDSEKMKASSKQVEQLWQNRRCPEGTVPIIRTQKSDILRKISLDENSNAHRMESAKLYVDTKNHGGEAFINIWNIYVAPGETSTASMFVGIKDKPDLINAGWIVSETIFGDNRTHLYVFWASDNGGCYNLKCPGFIQTNKNIEIGGTIASVSVYDGEQYSMKVKIYKDQRNDHWWLEHDLGPLGYWPGSLFKNMATSADLVQWGGQVSNTAPGGHHTSTQMGSGHFSKEGTKKAAFIYNCLYLDLEDITVDPALFPTRATKSSCYDVSKLETVNLPPNNIFFFGGPGGRNCDE
ncbi:hypothetical protein AAC387_Pa02g2919 [Persea americana]